MFIKGFEEENFCNYRKPAMFIGTPSCDFKCEKECGIKCCQNSELARTPAKYIADETLVRRYLSNPITQAVVLGGLEPMDTFEDTYEFIKLFRKKSNDDIIIYTGYTKEEIAGYIGILQEFPNIYFKFGRFIPNANKKFDEVLGVELASDNQYGERIS